MALRKFHTEGDEPTVPTPESMGGLSPEEALRVMQPLVKAALDSAITGLIEAGEAAMKEERALGKPGPKWNEFLDMIADRTKIDPDDKLRLVLVGRIVFLFIAARSMLPPNTDIDPGKIKFD